MEAEPTPTRDVPARAPLAAVPGRLRGVVRGVRGALCRPLARRALVIGGIAVAGWLLGAGNAASAADHPSTDGSPTISNPVNDQVGQAGGLVHTGSDAVHRTADSLDRSHLAKRDAEPTTSDPVRQKVGETGGLVHTGSDAVHRTTESLDRNPMAKRVRDDRLTDGLARPAATLLDRTGTTPRRPDVHRIAEPVTSLLDDGTNKVGKSLPVRSALGDPSSVVGSMTHDVRPGAQAKPGPGPQSGERAYGKAGAGSSGVRLAHPQAEHQRLTGGPSAGSRLTFGRPGQPRLLCAHSALACDHDAHPRPHAPTAPAPTGPESDTHGLVPSPVSAQSLPGTGDFAWGTTERMPRHLATVAPRRGVLPPVVRTAADEPALSPD